MRLVLAIGIIVGVFALVGILFYAISVWRNRRTGATGFVQRSRLTCPKCGGTFDYEWVPGAALTAVRLGKDRYMACPLCHRWSLFNIFDAAAPPAAGADPSPPAPPRAGAP